jgi:hypothetical protein
MNPTRASPTEDGHQIEMLADTPDFDSPVTKAGFQPEKHSDEGVLDDGSVGLPVASGLLDPRVEAYVDSFVRFASPYLARPELVRPLGTSGNYKNTESEILATFPRWGASLTRDQGLSLVREACYRLDEQVSSLRRRYDGAPPGNQQGPGVARVVYIRESPLVLAEGAQPAGADEEQATAGAADKKLA